MPTDPAIGRGPVPEFPYRREATMRMKEAALNLRAWLEADPRRLDLLEDWEIAVMQQFGAKGALASASRKLRDMERAEREAARRNRSTRRHPTRPSASLSAGYDGRLD